jgi:hypothetical protein
MGAAGQIHLGRVVDAGEARGEFVDVVGDAAQRYVGRPAVNTVATYLRNGVFEHRHVARLTRTGGICKMWLCQLATISDV